jgi:predicted nucleic acid-binding protein
VRRVVVDTSVLVDASRGDTQAVAFLADAVDTGEVWSITPVRTELRWGMRPAEGPNIDRLFASIYWLDVSSELADRAGSFGRAFGRSHGLGIVDALVAAAAEFLDAELATVNVRDFPMFPGLERPY